MKYSILLLTVLLCSYASSGCSLSKHSASSSSSSGGSAGSTSPPNQSSSVYDAVSTGSYGKLSSQKGTIVEYFPTSGTVTFSTVVGVVQTVGASRRITLNNIEYVVVFTPESHILILGELIDTSNYATWKITLIQAPG